MRTTQEKLPTGGAGIPGGDDTQIQFNDGGSFGGDANFTWDKTTSILSLGNIGTGLFAKLDTSFITGVDKTFTFPNQSGVIALVSDIPTNFANQALSNLTVTAINTDLTFADGNPRALVIATQTSPDTDGNDLEIRPGNGDGTGKGGLLIVHGGTGGATGDGGDLRLSGGTAGAGGVQGKVSIYDSTSGFHAYLNTALLSTSDKTFTFPNASGTFMLLPASPADYTTSNVTTDRAYNANATSIDELADVLGTLIADLTAIGLLQ